MARARSLLPLEWYAEASIVEGMVDIAVARCWSMSAMLDVAIVMDVVMIILQMKVDWRAI